MDKAISWLVASGIHIKMVSDTKAELKLPSYWTKPLGYENEPLLLRHILLPILLFFGSISLAMLIFFIERAYYKMKRMSGSVGRENIKEANRNIEDVVVHSVEL